MVIKVNSANIQIGSFTLSEDSTGLVFDGDLVSVSLTELGGKYLMGGVSGYTTGGISHAPSPAISNVIDKFSFATNANATDVGDLSVARMWGTGQSSKVSGYTSGGQSAPTTSSNIIDKFPFAADGNATDVGDLTTIRHLTSGQSSNDNGYTSNGVDPSLPGSSNVIDKFPFASNANATDVGDLTPTGGGTGHSSTSHGYSVGSSIDRFPFATNANATNVGPYSSPLNYAAGQSSSVAGYISGGGIPPNGSTTINKFLFSTNAVSNSVGDLSYGRYLSTGQSAMAAGYTSGGNALTPGSYTFIAAAGNVVDKFPFASEGTATDVGDLTVSRYKVQGQQH